MVRRRTRGAGPTAVAWLLLAQAQGAKGAVSSDDLLAYVGGTATGQTLTTAAYSLTMLANSTDCIVSLSWDGAMSDLGWLGWGLGTGMAKADIVVLWPNSDSSWTLSHRNAASTVMPTVVDSSATSDPSVDASGSLAVVASLSSSSSSDSPTVVTFSRPLTMPSEYSTDAEIKDLAQEINQPIIYAMGPTNPGDSDPATDFEQHALDSMGSTYMDLSATFSASAEAISAPLYSITGSSGGSSAAGGATSSGGAGATTAPSGSSEGGTGSGRGASSTGKASTGAGAGTGTGAIATATGSGAASSSTSTATASTNSTTSTSSYTTIIKYHAYAGAAAWLFAAPMGVLVARLGRHCLFFPWHWGFQVFVTTVLTTIAVGLAFYSTKLKGGTVTKDAHVYLGFGILFLVYTQCGIGLWIHLAGMAASAAEKARGRASRNWLHIGLGIILLIAGFVQVKLGMTKYGLSSTSKLIYVYWGAIALFSIIYLISALLAIANPPPPPAPPKKHHHHEAGRHHRHRPVHHSHRRERERREREKDEAERRRRRKKKAKKRRRRKEEEKNLISSDSESTGSGSGSRSGSKSGSGTESDSGSSTASSGKSRKRRR